MATFGILSIDYYPIKNHSWMNSADVNYRLEKMSLKEREILEALDELAPEVEKFDCTASWLTRKQDQLNDLLQQEKDLMDRFDSSFDFHEERRLLNLLGPLNGQIDGLRNEIDRLRGTLNTLPKDRSNLLNQQLRELREERTRLKAYTPRC